MTSGPASRWTSRPWLIHATKPGVGTWNISRQVTTVITVPVGGQPREFKCQNYLYHFAMLQVQFHATTAYDIIRSTGANIGKRDYLGQMPS